MKNYKLIFEIFYYTDSEHNRIKRITRTVDRLEHGDKLEKLIYNMLSNIQSKGLVITKDNHRLVTGEYIPNHQIHKINLTTRIEDEDSSDK